MGNFPCVKRENVRRPSPGGKLEALVSLWVSKHSRIFTQKVSFRQSSVSRARSLYKFSTPVAKRMNVPSYFLSHAIKHTTNQKTGKSLYTRWNCTRRYPMILPCIDCVTISVAWYKILTYMVYKHFPVIYYGICQLAFAFFLYTHSL